MLADRVRNVSEVWLGSSMGCAECHDHKFDPFTQKDFYSMAAFFADVDKYGSFAGTGHNTDPIARPPEILAWTLPLFKQIVELDKKIADAEATLTGHIPADHRPRQQAMIALKRQRLDLEAQFVPTLVTKAVKPRKIRVLPRGNWMDQSGEVVMPAAPEFLVGETPDGPRLTRLDLANWLISSVNPLTARVTANRLWKLFFGRGFSKELIDVGSQSEWPTHPELLDWLAVEFVDSGWDLKHMVRTLVMTNAYRQSSLRRPGLDRLDVENKLVARQSRYRMEAEQIRDTALHVSGLLVNQIGGDFARPYQPPGYYSKLNYPLRTYKPSKGAGQYRRGVYTHWQRQYLHPWLLAFDAPTREECTANRPISYAPSAALVLLNDPTFVESARAFATRVLTEAEVGEAAGATADERRVRWAWRQATSRQATSREVSVLLGLLESERLRFSSDAAAAEGLLAVGMCRRRRESRPVNWRPGLRSPGRC